MSTDEITTRRDLPPADIQTWFNLTYASYLVIDRDKLTSTEPGLEILAKVDEVHRAFAHLSLPDYRVRLGGWWPVGELDDEDLAAAGYQVNTPSGEATPTAEDEQEMDREEATYTNGVDEMQGWQEAFVPTPGGEQPRDSHVVVNRTLLQSMPTEWQHALVYLLRAHSDVMEARADEPGPASCEIQAGEWAGESFTPFVNGDPLPHYNRGRTRLEPRL